MIRQSLIKTSISLIGWQIENHEARPVLSVPAWPLFYHCRTSQRLNRWWLGFSHLCDLKCNMIPTIYHDISWLSLYVYLFGAFIVKCIWHCFQMSSRRGRNWNSLAHWLGSQDNTLMLTVLGSSICYVKWSTELKDEHKLFCYVLFHHHNIRIQFKMIISNIISKKGPYLLVDIVLWKQQIAKCLAETDSNTKL